MLASALILLLTSSNLSAAPFAKYFQFIQPDGVRLTLWGEGDEFHAVFETTAGYTVIFDPLQRAYFYAERASDGKSLVTTGVFAHTPAPSTLSQHVRIDSDAVNAAARVRQLQWDAETGVSRRWAQLKAQTLGTPLPPGQVGELPAPPETTTIGSRSGLTLLIDFSDAPATISQAEIESFLNSDSYTGFGNNGSVKEYFADVSASRLTYTNVATIYVRMTQPKTYYDDTSKSCGVQGRLLINDALAILKARNDYNDTILRTFDSLTTDGSGNVVAFNVLFAGSDSGVWTYGLWPHSSSLGNAVTLGNGKSVQRYQITNIGSSLELGTFCHENGHMLCNFPDIYDYDLLPGGGYDSKGGAGAFCLMNSGGHGTNPSQVSAYLKLAAGWVTVTDLDGTPDSTAILVAAPSSGYDHLYRYRRTGVPTEYFLLENRQKTGRDANLPAAGIAVWHIDELGDHNNQSMVPNSDHLNYEVTLVQADNLWHFENNNNSGDANDLYYQGNSAAAYSNSLSDASTPHAHWWDGSSSGMILNDFSASAMSMAFLAGSGGGGLPAPVLSAEPPVTPGTANTIYWSAVSPVAGIASPIQPQLPQATSSSPMTAGPAALPKSPIAESSIGTIAGTIPPSNISHKIQLPSASAAPPPQFSLQRVSESRTSDLDLMADQYPIPAQVTLNPATLFIPKNDVSKVPSASPPLQATILLNEAFEGAFPGTNWTLYGSPTWGDTSYDKYGGYWSGWCGKSAIDPANGYVDNMNSWMVHGPFNLAGATSAAMSFWYKNLSESGYDYFMWLASVDGTNFSGYKISGDQSSWRSQVFDLSNVPTLGDLRGQTQVWIAFVFSSDGSNSGPTYKGAYIDDIVITKDTTGTPDLAVYMPPSWNNYIPVGTTQLSGDAAHSGTEPYYDNQTLYFNWGSANQGNAIASGYRVHVEVTGEGGGSWDWTGITTDAGYWSHLISDQSFGPLAAGSHTLKLWLDYDNAVGESNESNNYFERTITVSTTTKPDLVVYKPLNWNNYIPVGTTQLSWDAAHDGTEPYYDNQTLYFNWGSLNQGSLSASGYRVRVEVTGTGGGIWEWAGVTTDSGYWTHLTSDQPFGPLATGSHTLRLWLDYDSTVSESDENNNYYERTITVSASTKPDLAPYEPAHWNSFIPVGTTQLNWDATHNETEPYYEDQTLYFNWGSVNQGNSIASDYRVHVEVTGAGGGTWDWTGVTTDAGYWSHLISDQSFGPLAAGSHTLKLWLDYDNVVGESNESNNYFERTIVVTTSTKPDLTVIKPSYWNNYIPVGTTQLSWDAAHNGTGPYYNNQTLYFNWGSANLGSAKASGYKIRVEVTGTGGGIWEWAGVTTDAGYWTYLTSDQPFGPLAAGSHALKLWLDYDNTVSESNENNNYYERTIIVSTLAPVEYYAECADNASFNSPMNSGWIQQTQYTFNNLASGQTYRYRVKARRGTTESVWSNVEFSQQATVATLMATKNGSGSGTVTSSPAGIDCGPTCQANFAYNQQVTLTANAISPSVFSGWSGEGCGGTGTCTVTMNQTRNVTATFTLPKKVRGQITSY